MQLIYNNVFSLEEFKQYDYILIGMNYYILIKNDNIKIIPIEFKYINFDQKLLKEDLLLSNYFIILPLNNIVLSKFNKYNFYILQYDFKSNNTELGFLIKEKSQFLIKEKIKQGIDLNNLKNFLDEDIYSFLKNLH